MKLNLNIWKILGVLVIIFCVYFFFKIFIYLGISVFLYLLGHPLSVRLKKIRLGKRKMPSALASLITIGLVVWLIVGLFYILVPPLITEINFLSQLNLGDVIHNLHEHFPATQKLLSKIGDEHEIEHNITAQVNEYINAENIGAILNHTVGYLANFAGGALCILFITFFLLKDEGLVKEGILLLTPSGFENTMNEIMHTSKKMLSRYFTGLFIDALIVGLATFIVMSALGINNAVLIAFCASLFNVVPYIGSMITISIALFFGITNCISLEQYQLILPTIDKIFFGLLCILLVDAFIIQPFIFSNSVKAHPLEIFLVTLLASAIGGVFGMIIALPTYTLLRIVAAQFLTHFKFFKKISNTISEK